MNLVAMNIDTFEERLLQRNSLLRPLLTTDCGAFLEFFLRVALSSSEYFAPCEESRFRISE